MSEWISVDVLLPELREIYQGSPLQSKAVLTFNGNCVSIGWYGETYKRRERRWTDALRRGAVVTHWMPLPEPPK